MSTGTQPLATLDDRYQVKSKAELIDGGIVPLMPFGRRPSRIVARVARSLDDHATATGQGEAYTANIGFAVPRLTSGRQSFSPDASFFLGPFPADAIRFLVGAPDFVAVEVRSENDHGEAAEASMAARRADDFEAGTRVVWDVDPIHQVIRKYDPTTNQPTLFTPGQTADAEPAVGGWVLAVARIFGELT